MTITQIDPPEGIGLGTVEWFVFNDVQDGADPGTGPDFIAPEGTLSFVSSVGKLLGPDFTMIRDVIVGVIDEEGFLCTPDLTTMVPVARGVQLVANDDPDLNPQGTVYNVSYQLKSRRTGKTLKYPESHQISVLTGQTVDLSNFITPDNPQAIGIPQATALAAAAAASAASAEQRAGVAEAAALVAQGAVLDSAEFVGDEIADPTSPAAVAVAAKMGAAAEDDASPLREGIDPVIDEKVGAATKGLVEPLNLTTPQPFRGLTRNTPGGPAPFIIGVDDERVFYRGLQGGNIGYGRMVGDVLGWRSDATATPADVSWPNCFQIVTFKGKHYLLARPTTNPTHAQHIYRTDIAPALGSTSLWAWTDVFTLGPDANGNGVATQMSTDGTYLYVCQYGDPTGGPKAWRTSDGVTFEEILSIPTARHMHAIEPDPFNPGHVWLTAGDGVPFSVMRSTDYGAPGSWEVLASSAGWQGVQISFHEKFVAFAHDNGAATWQVWDREAAEMRVGSPNWHRDISVPGGARVVAGSTYTPTVDSHYSQNSFYGAVDPDTGIYYAVANEANPNDWNGVFIANGPGQPLTLFDRGLPFGGNLNERVWFWRDRVFIGLWTLPRLGKA